LAAFIKAHIVYFNPARTANGVAVPRLRVVGQKQRRIGQRSSIEQAA
jgi:hypothetical protein